MFNKMIAVFVIALGFYGIAHAASTEEQLVPASKSAVPATPTSNGVDAEFIRYRGENLRISPEFEKFSLNGIVIHPVCIEKLTPSGEGSVPVSKSIAIDICQRSLDVYHKTVEANTYKGKTSYTYHREVDANTHEGGGYFSYEVLNKFPNDIYLINTWDNEGGSGTVEKLLFIKK